MTKELLDEYGYLTAEVNNGDTDIIKARQRMQEIEKELEKLIIEQYEKNNK